MYTHHSHDLSKFPVYLYSSLLVYMSACDCIHWVLQVAAVDLLIPGVGEVVGGSLREEREEVLRETLNR